MNAVLLIVSFAAIAAYEVPKLLSEGLYRELVAFTCVLGLGFVIGLLYLIGVDVPNPIEGMNSLIHWAGRVLRQLL